MSTTWYRISEWQEATIEAVEVQGETAKCLYIADAYVGQKRVYKEEGWGEPLYFRTWRECHDRMVLRAERRVAMAEEGLRYARDALEKVREMVDPTVEP